MSVTGAGLTQTQAVDAAEARLGDTGNAIWLAATLQLFLAEVVREISKRDPKRTWTALPIREYTKLVDISSLTSIMDILRVEYPVGFEEPEFRNYSLSEPDLNLIKLHLDGVPAITDGDLTGTLTFTLASNNVTGSGTAFTTELAEGYFIKLSDGTHWYRIAHIESDTSLYLEHNFAETTHIDDADSTDYRSEDSMVRILWRCQYTVAASTSDMPAKYDQVLVQGTVALAASNYAGSTLQARTTAAVSKISSAVTAIGYVTARVSQAITDILSQRTHITEYLSTFDDTIALMTARLANAYALLGIGDDLINAVNVGDQVPENYTAMAREEVEIARGYLEKAKASHGAITDATFISVATGELQIAKGYLEQAAGHLSTVENEVNVGELVARYRIWADTQMQIYLRMLEDIPLGDHGDEYDLVTEGWCSKEA